jgi:mevalonate kinase
MVHVGRGGAKLILFGEHAVVHGHPAIGTGLPGSIQATWEPATNALVTNVPDNQRPLVTRAFGLVAAHLGLGNPGGNLSIIGDIPPAAGFGSSGALCVALARAAFDSIHNEQQPANCTETIWAAAHAAETVFHGHPSGIDTGLALSGTLTLFKPRAGQLPDAQALPATGVWIVYGAVPRQTSCASTVAAIGKAMAAGDQVVHSAITRLGSISAAATDILRGLAPRQQTTAIQLGVLANAAMTTLRDLQLSTPVLDVLLETGLASGATGCKLSGGGAGGAFWLVCPDRPTAETVQAAIIDRANHLTLPGRAFTGTTRL